MKPSFASKPCAHFDPTVGSTIWGTTFGFFRSNLLQCSGHWFLCLFPLVTSWILCVQPQLDPFPGHSEGHESNEVQDRRWQAYQAGEPCGAMNLITGHVGLVSLFLGFSNLMPAKILASECRIHQTDVHDFCHVVDRYPLVI